MTTIHEAKEKLEDELATLRERADKILRTLEVLNELVEKEKRTAPKAAGKKAPKPAATVVAKPLKTTLKTTRKKTTQGDKATPLPDTGGEWFLSLITTKPQSRADILKAAESKAGGGLTNAAKVKLASRMSFTVRDLVRQKKIVAMEHPETKRLMYSRA